MKRYKNSLLEERRSGTQGKESGEIFNSWTGARKMAIYTGIIDIEHESLTMTAQSLQTVPKVFIGRIYQHVLLFLSFFSPYK